MEDTKTIFIIEDEKGMREALEEAFKSMGYETLSASDGEEALKIAEEQDFDVVLLDLILPKVDGFEVLKSLRQSKKNQSVPVLLCTNLSQSDNIQKALEYGATTYLVKANHSLMDITKKTKEVLEKSSK